MRVLLVDDEAKVNIKRVVDHASTHKVDFESLQKMARGNLPVPGDNPDLVCHLFDGFRVVFSIEQQPDKNWYRHLSISINDRTKLPHQEAVNMIMAEFGFVGSFSDCHLWIDKDNNPMAINLLQAIA